MKTMIKLSIGTLTSLSLMACGGLGDMAKMVPGGSELMAGADASQKASALAEGAIKLKEAEGKLAVKKAEFDKVQLEIKADEEALAALGDAPDTQAQRDELTAKIQSNQAILAKVQADLDAEQAKYQEVYADTKYGPKVIKGSASEAAKVTYEIPEVKSIELPEGKIALVNFSLNRQVIMEGHKDNQERQLAPGMLNDKAEYWKPQTEALAELYQAFTQSDIAKNEQILGYNQVKASAVYQSLAPQAKPGNGLIDLNPRKDYLLPEGAGYFEYSQAEKASQLAADLGVDYLLSIDYDAKFAAYDGDAADNRLQMRVGAIWTIVDKEGKLVSQTEINEISKNQALVMDDEIWPEAIPALITEANAGVLAKASENLKFAGTQQASNEASDQAEVENATEEPAAE